MELNMNSTPVFYVFFCILAISSIWIMIFMKKRESIFLK